MAVVFELVVNFGRNEAALQQAEEIVAGQAVTIRATELALKGPYVARFEGDNGYIEFSVVVPAIGAGGPSCPTPFDVRTLTDAEISVAGEQLYDLLKRFSSYEAAAVGWDPEGSVNLGELAVDLADGWSLPAGVVLARHTAERLGLADTLEPFAAEHLWVPYRGSHNLWNT